MKTENKVKAGIELKCELASFRCLEQEDDELIDEEKEMFEHEHYARVFKVKKFESDEDANQFMMQHAGWGALCEHEGFILVARMDDKGVPKLKHKKNKN